MSFSEITSIDNCSFAKGWTELLIIFMGIITATLRFDQTNRQHFLDFGWNL